nr:MAG TPA: hypothetical protein [Caudoviricetes sp.]
MWYEIKVEASTAAKYLYFAVLGVKKCPWWLQPPKARKTTTWQLSAIDTCKGSILFPFL